AVEGDVGLLGLLFGLTEPGMKLAEARVVRATTSVGGRHWLGCRSSSCRRCRLGGGRRIGGRRDAELRGVARRRLGHRWRSGGSARRCRDARRERLGWRAWWQRRRWPRRSSDRSGRNGGGAYGTCWWSR